MFKRFILEISITLLATIAAQSCFAMGGTRAAEGDASSDEAIRVDKGSKLYNQSCYKCHGPRAVSGGTIPDLRMFDGGETEFVATAMAGRPGTIMPAWKEFLSEEELKNIYAYVRSQAPK
ncbi:MAG: hypothetical protein EKK46_04970 [Rhodocyclaceae bacterium]|nr:MAG: hypothetical protein EKK46_04970 [Rhodocyclaceae bacterium]